MNVLLRTNDMKNSLPKQNEKKESNKLCCSDSIFLSKGVNRIWSSTQQITTFLFIPIVLFMLSLSTISAQTVENVDNYINNISSGESQHLNNLLKGENSTLFIFEDESEIEGNSSPIIANVSLESLSKIYSPNENFKNIELIRITVRNEDDLKFIINTVKLNHFQKLKYIYVVVTFDICPENQNNIDCQKSEISKMVSFSSGTANPIVLFKIVKSM